MEELIRALTIAYNAVKGAEDEAKTIATYVSQLIEIARQNLSEEELQSILAEYTEIIGDELDHINRFCKMFIALSGMQPKGE